LELIMMNCAENWWKVTEKTALRIGTQKELEISIVL
jgi:hypothetical protein